MKINLSLLDRNLIKALALMLTILTSSIIWGMEVQVTEQETATTYYYVDDDKIYVKPLYDRVAIRIHQASPHFFLDLQKLPSFKDIEEDSIETFYNIMIVSLKTEDDKSYLQALKELRTLENVNLVGVVVTDDYNTMITTGEIIVLFKDNVSQKDRSDIIERHNLTFKEDSGHSVLLQIHKNDENPINVFNQSNKLKESGLVHFAEPHFYILYRHY